MRKVVVWCAVLLSAWILFTILPNPKTETVDSLQPHFERPGEIEQVIDGDTLVLKGCEKVRLVGVNTPEIGSHAHPGGLDAKKFTQSLCPPGREVWLDIDDLCPHDRYGRTLAVVYLKAGNKWINLNAELLREGLADPLFLPPSEFNPYQWLGGAHSGQESQ